MGVQERGTTQERRAAKWKVSRFAWFGRLFGVQTAAAAAVDIWASVLHGSTKMLGHSRAARSQATS
jgi:hypothetical protein